MKRDYLPRTDPMNAEFETPSEAKSICDKVGFHPLKFLLGSLPKVALDEQIDIAKIILPYYYKVQREFGKRSADQPIPSDVLSDEQLLSVLLPDEGKKVVGHDQS